MSGKEAFVVLKHTYYHWRTIPSNLLAGGLAYFTLFSATPLLVLLISILSRVVATPDVLAQMDVFFSPRIGIAVREWLVPNDTAGLSTLTVLGALMLLYGASHVFLQLKTSLDWIWDTPDQRRGRWQGVFESVLMPLLMMAATALFILGSITLDASIGIARRIFGDVFPGLGWVGLWKLAGAAASWALLALSFAGIFKWIPSVKLSWREIWPGALFTSTLFMVGKFALGLYFGWRSFGSLYGAAGSLIAVMVWIYASAQMFLFGAVFTRVQARRHQGIQPNPGSQPALKT